MPVTKGTALLALPLLGLAMLAVAWLIPAQTTTRLGAEMSPAPPPPPKPESGIDISTTEELLHQLEHAAGGSTLILKPGIYQGPIQIDRGLTVWGPREAVIQTSGEGTTVRLRGNGSAALGFSIRGSGTRYDLLDAALELQGEKIRAIGLHISEAVYGIIANRSREIVLSGNLVEGTGQEALGLRGDGIRVWETYESEISHNRVRGARDMVIWYSNNNEIYDNEVHDCRYGTHLMYSHHNTVEGNKYVNNVVGLFSMYSRELHLENNIFAASSGSAGIGLGMKESSNLMVVNNLFVGNERGMYFDNSPFEKDTTIEVKGNQFYFSSVALDFHEPPEHVSLRGNLFRSNWSLIAVAGRGNALEIEAAGNDFGGYRGYDVDEDGFGDIPFEERSMSEQLISSHESLALFRGTPASGMLEAIGQLLPLYQPEALLRDETPALNLEEMEFQVQ